MMSMMTHPAKQKGSNVINVTTNHLKIWAKLCVCVCVAQELLYLGPHDGPTNYTIFFDQL